MEKPDDEIVSSFLKAWEYRPVRLEAAYNLIRFLVSRQRYFFGFTIASTCMRMQPCEDILFVEADIWSWKMADEYSVLAYYTGNIKESYNSCMHIMKAPIFNDIEKEEKDRILKNFETFEKVYKEVTEKGVERSKAKEEMVS